MEIRRIVPVIESSRLEETKRFYGEFLGLELAMDMDWVITYKSKENPTAQITIVKSKNEQLLNSSISISIEVPDLEVIFEKAIAMNYPITYPKTKETWEVERFFVKDPNGITINLMCHI